MDFVSVLLPLGLILLFCKAFSLICTRFGLPKVIGYLVAGLLLGLVKLIPNVGAKIFSEASSDGIGFIAKIGVILIMFSAGLEVDIKQIKATGIKAIIITTAGVVCPMALGFLAAAGMLDGGFANIANNYLEALSYGCILTATSVSVTVATLKELGKLNSMMGTCVTSAAILDDIIGVVVLSIVLGLDAGSGLETVDLSTQPLFVRLFANAGLDIAVSSVISIVIYFVIFGAAGIGLAKLFGHITKKYEHHQRIPVFSLVMCFLYAWFAEEFFGVADITGAFLAGLLLSTNHDRDYIDSKAEIFGVLLFTPVFFANIGINISFSSFDLNFVWFGIIFVICGILGKLLGCGLSAKACGFSWKDSASIGVGMMVRAEVALVCVDKLKSVVNENITTFVVLLILVTSLVTPILLKAINKDKATPISPELIQKEPVQNQQ